MLWALTGVDNRNAMFLGVWRSRVVVIRRKWCLRKKPGRLYWREISGPAWGRVIWPMQRGRTPRQCGPKRGGASRRSFFSSHFFLLDRTSAAQRIMSPIRRRIQRVLVDLFFIFYQDIPVSERPIDGLSA